MDSDVWYVIITIIAALLSGFLGYYGSNQVHKYDKTYKKKEKAIDLSKEFMQIISSGGFDITHINSQVLQELSLDKKLNVIDDVGYIHFDSTECNQYFSQQEINKFHTFKSLTNVKFMKMLSRNNIINNIELNEIYYIVSKLDEKKSLTEVLKEERWNEGKSEDDKIPSSEVYSYLIQIHNDFMMNENYTLNKLEWISMHFVNGIADEEVIYQSNHQLFLSAVKSVYIPLASRNRENHDKFYQNLITMFNTWNSRKQQKIQEEKEKSQSVRDTITEVQSLK
ncbi:hypothetical protein [Salinicoccus roseus]|uniref:Uncharacterized protein n=1 Tax=Salinicoccus roseus TaxID=45670 RepID=A0A0C2E3D5_9STAP|nr:hypothetical protein [Salinicoccus roseus]KIH69952.1 hypothetical protein SN16_10605 [Salinicoccus roseus]MDB0581250.1 hypothetical protein [Salinicoccus roseus]